MRLKIEKEQLKILIPVILGVLFIFISIIADPAFKTTVLNAENDANNNTHKNSANDFDIAYTKEFSLKQGERIYAKFSVDTENMTVNLLILSKAQYLTLSSANATAPNAVNGLGLSLTYVTFNPDITSVPPFGGPAGAEVTQTKLTYAGSVQLEFGGATNGAGGVLSVPGDYIIMVWGTNDWANDPSLTIPFSLLVTTEGPWYTIEVLFAVLAFLALAIAGLLALMEYKPSLFGGNEE
jgi:hypothetical protein